MLYLWLGIKCKFEKQTMSNSFVDLKGPYKKSQNSKQKCILKLSNSSGISEIKSLPEW